MRRLARHALPALLLLAAPLAAQDASAPIALSDPDGQELVIEELSVRAAVHGVFSLTEMEIVFRNPHPRRMEGRFTAVLPEGATVSRLAKEVNGRLMEGEVVERLRANRIYAEILHEMRDPALLEQDQGNRFSARIFPIEANATVRVVLGYTRLLPLEAGERVFRVPLRGLPRIGVMRLSARVEPLPDEELIGSTLPAGARAERGGTLAWEDEGFVPAEDLEFRWRPRPGSPRDYLLRAGSYYLAGVRPDVAPAPPAGADARWVFLLDTSASGAEGLEHRLAALRAVLAALPGRRVELVAFDQEVAPLGAFAPAEAARRVEGLLRDRVFLGGTDLHAALAYLGERARREPGTRFVLVSDGAATMGRTDPAELFRPLDALPAGTLLSALVLGAREDALALRQVTEGRGRVVRVPFTEGMRDRAAAAAARLALPPGRTVPVADPAAERIHVLGAGDAQAGGEVLVLGRLPGRAHPRLSVDGVLAGRGVRLDAARFGPLLVREFHRAHLEWLQQEERFADGADARARLADEQVRLSVEHRVMVPRTTLLVLESEADYARFGLERRGLAQVLTVGPRGVQRLDRAPLPRLAAGEGRRVEEDDDAEVPGDVALRERPAPTGAPAPARERRERREGAPAPMAPPPPPPPPAPPPPPPPSPAMLEAVVGSDAESPARRVLPAWVTAARFRPGEADSLLAALEASPRDRTLYNRLSEALAHAERWTALREVALRWQPMDADNPQVYESLALASSRLGRTDEARRATGSLVEVAPSRPEMLQRAALLLWRAGDRARWEAPARRAVEMRPDLPNPYRTLALLLWRTGRFEEAAEVLERALAMPVDRWYGNAAQVVRDELGYVYRDWIAAEPGRAEEVRARAASHRVDLGRSDRLRITMTWDTDGNDVDLHVVDPEGAHVYYANRTAPSGLRLLEDITQGFGPEVVRTDSVVPGPYHVGVKYFNAGPMGISRGTIVVMEPGPDGVRVRVEPFRLVPASGGGGEVQRVLSLEPAGPGR